MIIIMAWIILIVIFNSGNINNNETINDDRKKVKKFAYHFNESRKIQDFGGSRILPLHLKAVSAK